MARVWIYSIVALSAMVPGAAIMLRSLGAFGPIATSPDGPAWLGVLMGFTFVAGGASVMIKVIYGGADPSQSELPADAPVLARVINNILGFAIVAALAILLSWVAFGPGERHFSGSGAFLGAMVGRAMFGLGAVMTWLALGWFGMRWFKRRRA